MISKNFKNLTPIAGVLKRRHEAMEVTNFLRRMSPLLALFRHAEHGGRCPFPGAERKWRRPAATSPFDPTATLLIAAPDRRNVL
jgi:hypothetical protein